MPHGPYAHGGHIVPRDGKKLGITTIDLARKKKHESGVIRQSYTLVSQDKMAPV